VKRVAPRRWSLLIHHLPPEPLYLRARIRQLLARAGAVPLKRSVYVLPAGKPHVEELERIGREAEGGGGEAFVCRAEFAARRTDAAIVRQFRQARHADWASLARLLSQRSREGSTAEEPLAARLARARKRYAEIARIDFFGAAGRKDVDRRVKSLARRLADEQKRPEPPLSPERSALVGRTWVTRRGVLVDRIASAWFIRRFLDPKARFRFADPNDAEIEPNEIRFDMPGGEFSHEEDRCTLETLVRRTRVEDPALAQVAEIVHAIDLKDGKFARPEARGIEQLLAGLLLGHPEDAERLERGFALFDQLYRSFHKTKPFPQEAPR
jgi:hypothetical protein